MLESYLLKPKDKPSDTVLVFMHPIGGGAYLPMINALARGGPPRHLLQQPVPRHRLRAADGEGRRGPRRVHQGRQEPARLRQGRAGRLERRRLAVGVLPAAGAEPDGDREPVRRRARPDEARADPRRRHHAAGRARQPPRHADRVAGRVDPRRVRPDQARSRAGPVQPRQPQPAAVHRGVPRRATAQAQIARNRRITKWVKDKLAELKAAGRPDDEFAFVVHGTMADPRWLDPDGRPERTRAAD